MCIGVTYPGGIRCTYACVIHSSCIDYTWRFKHALQTSRTITYMRRVIISVTIPLFTRNIIEIRLAINFPLGRSFNDDLREISEIVKVESIKRKAMTFVNQRTFRRKILLLCGLRNLIISMLFIVNQIYSQSVI